QVEGDATVRVAGQRPAIDDNLLNVDPLLLTQVSQLQIEPLLPVIRLKLVELEQVDDLVEPRVGLRRVGDHHAAPAFEGLPDIVSDGANHATVCDGVDPALRVARMVLLHEVRLEEDEVGRSDEFAERIPRRLAEVPGIEASEVQRLAHGAVDMVRLQATVGGRAEFRKRLVRGKGRAGMVRGLLAKYNDDAGIVQSPLTSCRHSAAG